MAFRIASLLLAISPAFIVAQDFVVGSSSSGACIGSYCCDGSLIGGTGNSNDASDFTCCLGDPNHGIINGVPDMTCSAGTAVPLTAATGSGTAATASATTTSSNASPTSDDSSSDDDDSDNSSTATESEAAAATASATASGSMGSVSTSQRSSASSSSTPTSSSSESASASSKSASASATDNAAVGGYQFSAGQVAIGLLALGYNVAL